MKPFLSVSLLFFPFVLQAQELDTLKIYDSDAITVIGEKELNISDYNRIAARIPLSIQDTPLSIQVVTQKTLRDQKAVTLSDALFNVSSINVQSNLGTQDYFMIRGFESTTAGLVLINGIRAPVLSLYKFYGFGFFDLYNIEHIEVLKGPSAFLYGGNTLSGSIELVRKQPLLQNFCSIGIGHSRFGSYRETIDLGLAKPAGNLAFRLNGLWQFNGSFREHARANSYAVTPALTWLPSRRDSVTIYAEYLKNEISPDSGIPLYRPFARWELPPVSRDLSFQTPFDKVDYTILRLEANYYRRLLNGIRLNDKFYLTHIQGLSRFTMAQTPYSNAYGTWIMNRHLYNLDENQFLIGNRFEVPINTRIGSWKHKMFIGLEAELVRQHSSKWTTYLSPLPYLNPIEFPMKFDDLITSKIVIKTNTDESLLAPYLVDYTSLSEKVHMLMGFRLDYAWFKTDRRNDPFDYTYRELTSKPLSYSTKWVHYSPMVGILYKDSPNLQFYYNAGKSFGEGTRSIDAAETSTQMELGYKYRMANNRLVNSIAIYRIDRYGISIPLTGPMQGGIYSADGKQRSQGFEFELAAYPWSSVYAQLIYTFTEAIYLKYRALTIDDYVQLVLRDFRGKLPPFVPAQTASFWLHYEHPSGFSLSGGYQFIDTQYINNDNDFRIPAYEIYQLHIGYRRHNLELKLRFYNLKDTRYLRRGLGAYSVIPSEPFYTEGLLGVYF